MQNNTATSQDRPLSPLAVYDRTMQVVTENFYDRSFRGLPWETLVRAGRIEIQDNMDVARLCAVINKTLSQLRASHTRFLSSADQEFWALKSIFSHDIDHGAFHHVGAAFRKAGEQWFVRNVMQSSAAAAAGLLPGDCILDAAGSEFEPVLSFFHGTETALRFKRAPRGKPATVTLKPRAESLQRAMLNASRASARVISVEGRRIGYFHLWAGTHDEFRKALADCAANFAGKTDAFVLDLRDGYGGAGPEYVEPFGDVYRKPLVAIVNGGTRSGKEWVAHLLKDSGRAALVGARTAGWFLAGKPFEIAPDLFTLFLAVGGNGPQGVDLEGKGVEPDIPVPMPLEFLAGHDAQLDAALRKAAEMTTAA